MRLAICAAAAFGLLAAPTVAQPLVPGDVLRVRFTVTPSTFVGVPDVLVFDLNGGSIGQTSDQVRIYNGATLLGTESSPNAPFSDKFFRTAASSWTVGTTIDFSSIVSGSIQGLVEYRITSGTGVFRAVQMSLGTSMPDGGAFFHGSVLITSIEVVSPDGDTDADGLWDVWETTGLDTDNNGTVDLRLQDLGNAGPLHKDLYVYYDWVPGERPSQAVLSKVATAFATAPAVSRVGKPLNPDNTPGVSVHFLPGVERPEPEFQWLVVSAPDHLALLRRAYLPSKYRSLARYVLFAKRLDYVEDGVQRQRAGIATIRGAAAVVGTELVRAESKDLETGLAGTLMHELGHNLGLDHGGIGVAGASRNNKPNHISVMNYSFQLNGLVGPKVYLGGLVTDYQHIGTLDFSRFSSSELPPLNEDALDESLGLSGSASETRLSSLGTIFWCPDQLARKVGPLTGASVNWDCLPTFSTTVRVDVNKDRDYTTLHSSDEWGNLAFAGGGVGTATGVPETEGTLPDGELSAEELDSQGPAVTRDITIDIKPGPGPNDVNLRSNGTIPVALLSDESFDPLTDVDRSSIRFGATGYDTRALRCAGERVNADRILDLVCHFRVSELGFTAFSKAGLLRAVSPSLKQIVFGAEVIRPIP